MSSPNDPSYPRTGDGPGTANGSAAGDVPPWQRGPSGRTANQPHREPSARAEAPRAGGPPDSSRGGSSGHSPVGSSTLDSRLNRFAAGGAPAQTPDAEAPARPDRSDTGRPESYGSELPDLSGGIPRSPQRKLAPERATAERPTPEPPNRPSASRIQVATRHTGPVRASMQIRRVDPWSALKVSLVLSVALFFVWMIAVAFLYLVLGGMGVWSKLNSNVGDLLTSASGQTGGELVSSGTIFGGAALIGLVNIVLMTAMATVAAFIYNLTTDLVGGVEVTLADRD